MRKYINITTALTAILLLTVMSCKKTFLEITPKGNLIATTYDDYNLLMNDQVFYLSTNIGLWSPAMLMGDDVGGEENQFNSSRVPRSARTLFEWSNMPFPLSSDYNTQQPQFLNEYLTNMYTLNKIINQVMGVPGGTAQQEAEVQSEAMCMRAFYNFQLINYFAKPYTTATAASDPGFPIITTTDLTATNFPRGTVQQMYDFIIKDLATAIPNLNVQPSFPTRWSKGGAEGMLGKVYLFMGNYAKALEMLKASFNDIANMTTPPHLYNYNLTFAPGGSFLPISTVSGPASLFNNETDFSTSVLANVSYSGSYNGNGYGNDFLTLSPQTAALYDPADWRLKFYTNLQANQKPNPGGRLRKYGVTYSRIGVELSDLYLLKAECEARTGDLSGAVTDVETLRKNRLPATNADVPTATAADATALTKFIIDERTREFAAEGYRWWDMRRLSVDPIFSGQPAAVHIIYLTAGGTTKYTLVPARLTLQLPQYYINKNPGMVNNP